VGRKRKFLISKNVLTKSFEVKYEVFELQLCAFASLREVFSSKLKQVEYDRCC